MQIKLKNKTISSVPFSNSEVAWRIEDAISGLQYFKDSERIVLGGDVLTTSLKYTYDNWYYNPVLDQSLRLNIDQSVEVASKYILEYLRRNGTGYFIVFVVR